MEQAWYNALTVGLTEKIGQHNPFVPPNIFYVNNGVVEVWESLEAINWFYDFFQNDRKDLVQQSILSYKEKMTALEPYFKRRKVHSFTDLNKLITQIYEIKDDFAFLYYAATARNNTEGRLLAVKIRENDTFFDDADKSLRSSLLTLYPFLKGLETTLLVEEIPNNIPPLAELVRRKKFFVLVPGLFQETVTLADFQEVHSQFLLEQPVIDSEIKEFNGRMAFQGKVKGKVRVIRQKAQIPLLQKGEILVSPMTTPDFVPAMEKAAAIITDEGGILCHAAIVSREMRKPCIVGTEIATKVLKDGDVVEVDATNGVVKIIKR